VRFSQCVVKSSQSGNRVRTLLIVTSSPLISAQAVPATSGARGRHCRLQREPPQEDKGEGSEDGRQFQQFSRQKSRRRAE